MNQSSEWSKYSFNVEKKFRANSRAIQELNVNKFYTELQMSNLRVEVEKDDL